MPYTVPTGYFEQLDKRLEKVMGSDEHTILDTVDKQMPYQVPAGYFDGLAERMLQKAVRTADHSHRTGWNGCYFSFAGQKFKEMLFHVPAGYFESLASDVRC